MKSRDEHLAMIREASKPIVPVPTGESAHLNPLRNVEAILLDVYGTLLVSSSGEIGTGDTPAHAGAFRQALSEAGLELLVEDAAGLLCLQDTIRKYHQRARESGVDFPEVDIVEVWRATLEELRRRDEILGNIAHVDLPTLSLQYELRTNPVWPMPGAAACLMELANRGIRLGVISNAQWFTPLLFPALLGGELDAIGIGTEMQFWSWQVGCAKPSEVLYRHAARYLGLQGIQPEHVVHVGNDMLNDVLPAAKVGFRTALFAGDQRSLRLREGDVRVVGVTADLVIVQLHDLLGCVRPVRGG